MKPDEPKAASRRGPAKGQPKRTRSKALNWAAITSIVGAMAAVIVAVVKKQPASQNTVSPNITVSAGSPNNITIVAPPAKNEAPPLQTENQASSPAATKAFREKPALTDAERQLLEETQQDGETKMLLAPFLSTIDPSKRPSYSTLRPMLTTTTNGLEAIYKFLRATTNSATSNPWIEAAPARTFYVPVGTPEWTDHEPTKQLLIERQQLLRKYVVVLAKAGVLGP